MAKLQNVAPPRNASQVRNFLGMANTCSDYFPNSAAMTLRIRELKKIMFKLTLDKQRAFSQLKQKPGRILYNFLEGVGLAFANKNDLAGYTRAWPLNFGLLYAMKLW